MGKISGKLYGYVRQHHVALVAVFLAMTGTAVALPGKNTVDSGDIKKGQVKGSDLAQGSVTSPTVVDDALTGADLSEGTLGQVPSAQVAQTANTAQSAGTADSATNAGNAEMLDSLNSTAFALSGHDHDSTYVNEGQMNSVSAGMITDLTRSASVPLTAFVDCQTDSGAFLDFASGADPIADFINSASDGQGFSIRFDDDAANTDVDSEICSQVTAPGDFASNPAVRVRVTKPSNVGGVDTERLECAGGVNAGATTGLSQTPIVGGASQSIDCPLALTVAPGDTVAFYLAIDSTTTMDDPVDLRSVAFRYTATQ